jgi:hypothetical protein
MNTQLLQQMNTQINTVVQELRDRSDVIDAKTSPTLSAEEHVQQNASGHASLPM